MTFVRIVNERILAEEHTNERINIVSAKSILKAAEAGDLEYLTKAVNTVELCNIEDTMTMMTQSDKKGRQPLHLASMNGHIHIARLFWKVILESFQDKYTRSEYLDVQDNKGRTPLFYAAAGGYVNICHYLLERDADTEISTNGNHSAPGSTPLMAAAEKNKADCFDLLLRKGADIIAERKDNADSLYLAARNGNTEIVKTIVKSKRLILLLSRSSFHGRNALITAALHGHLDACKELHARGFDINHQDDDKFTALIYATNAGHFDIVRWLLKNSANVYLKDKYGATAWDNAVASGYMEIAHFLREWRENIEQEEQIKENKRRKA